MCDFIELSRISLNNYRSSLDSENDRYEKTLYVAISENNSVSCAYDPEILREAHQCILIHCKSSLSVTRWCNWYKGEFINHNGINLGGIIGNDCHFKIDWVGTWANKILTLYHRDDEIYTCRPPFEGHMQGLWDAYCNTLSRNTDEIENLRAELHQKEIRIVQLEDALIQYHQTIEGIKQLIRNCEE